MKDFLQNNKHTLDRLTAFMLDYNKRVNLTRIVAPDEINEKHYIDSILPLTLYNVPRGTIALDVGSGAGFPGIPMKLFRPDLGITLLDSSRKRTDYLNALLSEIGVDCKVVTARSEELAHNPDFREKFGLVTARAVANLPALCEYCLPFVMVGGVFLALKGESGETETESSAEAFGRLGADADSAECIKYALPSGDWRSLIAVKKIRHTPANYPRKRVNITKNPL